jgi:hypothetical protein
MAVTPNYSWPVPVATDYVKDGWEAISDLGNAIDTTVAGLGSSGLTLISAQTMTTNTLNFTNVFNSTYSHYLLVGNCYNSGNQTMLIRSRQNTTDYSGSGYYGAFFTANYNATTTIEGRNNSTYGYAVQQSGSSNEQSQVMMKLFPTGNALTGTGTIWDAYSNGAGFVGVSVLGSATCTGFTLYSASGTQNGSFALYGFKKS